MYHVTSLFPYYNSNLPVKRFLFLLNAAFAKHKFISIFHNANYLSSYFEVSKPLKSFLHKVSAG
jgi:hypothetical protein